MSSSSGGVKITGNTSTETEPLESIKYWETLAKTSKEVCQSIYSEVARVNSTATRFLATLLTITGILFSTFTFIYVHENDLLSEMRLISSWFEFFGLIFLSISVLFLINAILYTFKALLIGGVAFGPDPVTLKGIPEHDNIKLQQDIYYSYSLSALLNRIQLITNRLDIDRAFYSVVIFVLIFFYGLIPQMGSSEFPNEICEISFLFFYVGSVILIYILTLKKIKVKFIERENEINHLRMTIKKEAKDHPCFDEINDIVDDIKPLPILKSLKKAIKEKPRKKFDTKSKEGRKVTVNTVIIRSALTDFRKAKEEK